MAESVRRRLGLAMLAVTAMAGCAANEPADVAVSVPAAEVPRPHAASVEPGSGCATLVDAACAITPGLESPTVSHLQNRDWFAVRAMVPRSGTNAVMDELYDLGARAILVTDITACRL